MIEPQITYRGMQHSPAMDARILELAEKLEEFNPKITRCHVVIEEMDRHKQHGNQFTARIDLHVPGRELVATHQHHEDAYAAITQAFDVIFRQLDEENTLRREELRHRGHPDEATPP